MYNENLLVISYPYASSKGKTRREILAKLLVRLSLRTDELTIVRLSKRTDGLSIVRPSIKDGRVYYRPLVHKGQGRLLHVSTEWKNVPSLVKSNRYEM